MTNTATAPTTPSTATVGRALVRVPALIRPGEVIEVRVLLQHPMETGYRPGPNGVILPRDIVRRVEARLDGELVFAADLFPAITANPYIAFPLRVEQAGVLLLSFTGDHGYQHSESATLTVA
jgi:sulfur-oxidizing protein SoxZ